MIYNSNINVNILENSIGSLWDTSLGKTSLRGMVTKSSMHKEKKIS